MSGGHWNYEDGNVEDISIERIPKILEAVRKCFHAIDWAESNDTTRVDAEPEIYNILLKLGDELFNVR